MENQKDGLNDGLIVKIVLDFGSKRLRQAPKNFEALRSIV